MKKSPNSSVAGSTATESSRRDLTARRHEDERRERLIERLTASNIQLEHFGRVAAHDLREPLRMVTSFCELLSKDYGDRLDERGREQLSLVVSASTQMRALLDDLVEFEEAGSKGGAWFEASEPLEHALTALGLAIQESAALVTYDRLPRIYGNPIRFGRLLQNLVGNALKYVAPGAAPRVHVSAVAEGAFWRFSVSDNGIGVESAHRAQIFEPFQRLHSKSHYQGSGLGLPICRKIVEGFGGRIWVDSAPGEGSTFNFTVSLHEKGGDDDRLQ